MDRDRLVGPPKESVMALAQDRDYYDDEEETLKDLDFPGLPS
jgi:hypothetical protein